MLENSYKNVKELFIECIDLEDDDRKVLLEKRCLNNKELYRQVTELLENDRKLASRNNPFPLNNTILDKCLFSSTQQTFGKYRILRLLGQGGMGSVFLGKRIDGEFEKQVAIKVSQIRLKTAHHKSLFRLERQTLASLEHPSICRLLDGGTTDEGDPYIVMEYVEGVPITEFCRNKKLSIKERLELLLKVCEGVIYAHAHSVVHRDLKPSNILVNHQKQPKLIDFGLARLSSSTSDISDDNGDNHTRVYTPEFASPEQLLGKKLSIATDIYSLGIILYHLISGKSPYSTNNFSVSETIKERLSPPPSIKMARIASDTWDKVWDENYRIDELEAILRKTLSYEARHRYQTVEHFVNDINSYLNLRPITAVKPNLRNKLSLCCKRHRLASAAFFFSSILVSSLLVVLVYKNRQLAYEKDLAAMEIARADTINHLLLSSFTQVDPYNAKGKAKSAKEVIVAASEEIPRLKNLSPYVRYSLNRSIGEVFLNLADFDNAKKHLKLAQQSGHISLPDDTAKNAIALGFAELGLGNLDNTDKYINIALKNIKKIKHNESARLSANTHFLHARLYQERTEWEEAITSHLNASEQYKKFESTGNDDAIPNRIYLAKAYISNREYEKANKLLSSLHQQLVDDKLLQSPHFVQVQATRAHLYWYQDRWLEAEVLLEKQITDVSSLYGENSDLGIDTVGMLASVKYMLAKTVESKSYHKLSIEMTAKKYGERHIKMTGLLTNYGNFLQATGDYTEAEVTLGNAMALSLEHFGANHDTTQYSKWVLGIVKGRLGKLKSSILLMTEAESVFRSKYKDTEYPISEIQQTIGIAMFFNQDYESAEAYLQHSQRNALARDEPNPKVIKENLRYLTKLYERLENNEKLLSANRLVESALENLKSEH